MDRLCDCNSQANTRALALVLYMFKCFIRQVVPVEYRAKQVRSLDDYYRQQLPRMHNTIHPVNLHNTSKVSIFIFIYLFINVIHRRLPSHQWLTSDKLITK